MLIQKSECKKGRKEFSLFSFQFFFSRHWTCIAPETFRQDDLSKLNQMFLRHWRLTTGYLWLMGNLCQCLFTLTVKNSFLISNLNLPSSFARLDTQSTAFTCISCGTCTSALHICLSGENLWLCRAWIFQAVYADVLCTYSLHTLAPSIYTNAVFLGLVG